MRMTQFRFCACAEEVLAKLRAAHAQCRLEAKGGVVSGRRRMRMTQFRFCACAETACPLGAGLRPRTYGLRRRPRKWGSFPARAARRRARGGAEPSPAAWKTFGPGRAAARWVSARPEGGRAGGGRRAAAERGGGCGGPALGRGGERLVPAAGGLRRAARPGPGPAGLPAVLVSPAATVVSGLLTVLPILGWFFFFVFFFFFVSRGCAATSARRRGAAAGRPRCSPLVAAWRGPGEGGVGPRRPAAPPPPAASGLPGQPPQLCAGLCLSPSRRPEPRQRAGTGSALQV